MYLPRSLQILSILITQLQSQGVSNHTALQLDIRHDQDQSYTDDDTFKQEALNFHNWYRAQHGALPMVWSDSLAQTKASVDHFWGENLAENYPAMTLAIDGWGLERVLYDWNNPRFSEATGHFTQTVWKASTQVGCGRNYCSHGSAFDWLLVCHYLPPGNVDAAFEFSANVGRQISGSPEVGIGSHVDTSGQPTGHSSGTGRRGVGILAIWGMVTGAVIVLAHTPFA